GQKGSSAMPHKRNPVVSERVSGLARVIRGHALAALENVTLWHERDISHSSAERMIFPDATGLLAFMLDDLTDVIDRLVVFPERMRENLDARGGIAFSQSVLLALVEAGLPRDEAYRVVQAAAAAAWDEGASFRETVTADPEVRARLDDAALAELFDPSRFLRNLGPVFERLEKLPADPLPRAAAGDVAT
ncbi:MAG: lyase family protein, partial [Actinomycetota bacterium]